MIEPAAILFFGCLLDYFLGDPRYRLHPVRIMGGCISILEKTVKRLAGTGKTGAFLVTVLPEIPDQGRALSELHRVIKPGGLLSITEEFSDPDYPFAFETVRRVESAGFSMERRFGNIWVYTLNFRKPLALHERKSML